MSGEVRLDCKMCGIKMYDTTISEVWFVSGVENISSNVWRTEMDAEIYAKRTYPDESSDKRCARIYSEKILSYDQQYYPLNLYKNEGETT
jgi:hypothetical protein